MRPVFDVGNIGPGARRALATFRGERVALNPGNSYWPGGFVLARWWGVLYFLGVLSFSIHLVFAIGNVN